MNILNRRELLTTFDLRAQDRVRDILRANGIKYDVKTVNRKSSSPFSAGSRGHTGTAFENMQYAYNYRIYVHKDDYENALHLIRQR